MTTLTNLPQVLKIHGISSIEVNGMISPTQRSQAIEKFKNSDRNGVRVLILSQVGMTGLNLPVANILIMVVRTQYHLTNHNSAAAQDTLWSAQDDSQLIGRIWRHPQLKVVHVYRLIADKTSDVFLNNISFDKAQMHEAFTGSTPAIRK
jgi:SNF2 family DNA or RNA helicase